MIGPARRVGHPPYFDIPKKVSRQPPTLPIHSASTIELAPVVHRVCVHSLLLRHAREKTLRAASSVAQYRTSRQCSTAAVCSLNLTYSGVMFYPNQGQWPQPDGYL